VRCGLLISAWLPRAAPWLSFHDLDPNAPRALVLHVPLTTQSKQSHYEVALPKLNFLDRESFANVQGLASIPTVRLERRLGRLPAVVMTELKSALAFALDL
jgi:mRNA interferase MazF